MSLLLIRPYRGEKDDKALYEAYHIFLKDHFGFEEYSFEKWKITIKAVTSFKEADLWQLAWIDQKLVGFCMSAIYPYLRNYKEAEIIYLAVHPDYRRQGIGSQLLNVILSLIKSKGIRRINVYVDKNNDSLSFYQRFGFFEENS
ncbi:MAG: GNAT family N-acetyltransferase [Proteobacteria bacterium]|nr:GNAT family N-acetyltransferase [Pseudomonadota bacterium]